MTDHVYHFTDTGRLPWIVADGALIPGRNNSGRYPDPDFLWATTNPRGSMSATWSKEGYRQQITRLVRFTLWACDFEPWLDVVGRYPAWTSGFVENLKLTARGDHHIDWVARVEPLQSIGWAAIHTKGYDGDWRPWAGSAMVLADDTLAIQVDDALYESHRIGADRAAGQPMAYAVTRRRI